ncbi:MAG: hypothetical protein LUD02_15285 [Tannerellaceae bacterium]|nr:hypothetical protein [Tannerellaceae bacterium]
MRTLSITLICLLMSVRMVVAGDNGFETVVRTAVNDQLEIYPNSTLKDLYKNFFQDKFGPGHLIADTTAAGNYLRRELASMTVSDGLMAEPTGWEGNFVRVNLLAIKDGFIPYDLFFDAFVRSVNSIQPVSIAAWQQEWEQIEAVIASMDLNLPGYATDKKEIDERLHAGEYVGHHSERFETSYSPRYRIISRHIFETEILPLLPSTCTR